MVSNLRGLLGSALTASSRRQYQRAWAVFRQFYCRFYGSENPILPLVPNCIPLFISYLSFRKMAYSTINSYLSAISYVHKLKGLRDPTKSFLIQKLLTALSRQRAADVRLPVTKPVLHQLVRSLDFTNSSGWHRSLFGTIFLVAFYGLFRIGELVVKSTHLGSSVVQYHSLTFLTCNGLPHIAKISISEYKHNPSKRPFNILLAREDVPSLCPVTALLQYTRLRGDRSGPLFCNADFSPMSLHQFNTELQRCLTYCGLDLSRYKSHSFRIGGACHAADNGFSDAQIRALGRWKSDAFKVNLRSEFRTTN